MKKTLIFIVILLFTYCTSKNKTIIQPTCTSYMDSILPFMQAFSLDTAAIFDWNGSQSMPSSHYEDEPITHIVGKFIDKKGIFALDYVPLDTLIKFYRFDMDKWKLIGSYEAIADSMTFLVGFVDMNNDGNNEIIVRTPPNMNGNSNQEVFRYSIENESIEYAGSFFGDYKIKKESKTVEVIHEGSSYMPLNKIIYQWHNNKLIVIKEIDLEITDTFDDRIFKYYENVDYDKDSLVLKIEVPFEGKKYKNMWDNFFEEAIGKK